MGMDFTFEILFFFGKSIFEQPRFSDNRYYALFCRSLSIKINPNKIIFVLSTADYTSTKSQQIEQLGESRFPNVKKSEKSRSQEDF